MELLRYEVFEGKKSKYTDEITKIKDRMKNLKKDKKRMIQRHEYELFDIKRRLADLKERKKRLLDYRKKRLEN